MAQGINKVILVGNLGADPEMKYTNSGKPVTNFRMATSEAWNDQNGERQERTEWHRIVVWGKLAEICGNYLKKGRRVFLDGKIQTRQYEKDGEQRYITEINAQNIIFLDGAGDSGSDRSSGGYSQSTTVDAYGGAPSVRDRRPPFDDSDIPF